MPSNANRKRKITDVTNTTPLKKKNKCTPTLSPASLKMIKRLLEKVPLGDKHGLPFSYTPSVGIFLYVMIMECDGVTYLKLGKSEDPGRRFRDFKSSHRATKVEIVALWKLKDSNAENTLHWLLHKPGNSQITLPKCGTINGKAATEFYQGIEQSFKLIQYYIKMLRSKEEPLQEIFTRKVEEVMDLVRLMDAGQQ